MRTCDESYGEMVMILYHGSDVVVEKPILIESTVPFEIYRAVGILEEVAA